MTARRALFLALVLTAAAVSALGQLVISPASLPVGGGVFVVGQTIPPQHLTVGAPFQNDPITWSVSGGSYPPGLNPPDDTGTITGTPTQAGAFTFTVMAVDNQSAAGPPPPPGFQQYTIFVSTGVALTLTGVAHPSAAVGSPYFGRLFQASGGVPGYTWAFQSGTNSDGLTIDPSGVLTGTPLTGGIFPIGIVVFDAIGTPALSSASLNVLGIATTSLPNGFLSVAYSQTLAAVGNTGVLSWSVPPGTLPPGLSLSPQGQIAGTPTAGGSYVFPVTVTDSVTSLSATASLGINIPLNLTVTTTSLPNGTVGTPYSQTLAATGGSGPLNWVLLSGAPPAGLTLSSQGQITGTPTQAGTASFQVKVTDPVTSLTATQLLSISITATLTVSTTSLPNAAIGLNYSQTLQATGGTPPYTWSATPPLPAGLTLDPTTGILSGTPTALGVSPPFSVTVTDSVKGTATAPLTLTVGALAISPATLPNGFIGVPYSTVTLTVSGNPTVTNWAVTSGTLPSGLNLNATTGVISGTPTAAFSSPFTISATLGGTVAALPPVQKQFTVVISAPPAATISGLPSTGVAATQPAATVALTGGTYPLNITGTMTLTFASSVGGDDQMVKFSNGSRTATFTIAAGATQGLFGTASSVSVVIGTVAGTITIATSLQDALGNPLPPPAPIIITVNSTVPVITNVTPGAVTSSGFSISVTGRSTSRNMTSALFHFTSPTGTQLASADVTVPLTTAFTSWYASTASNAFGSQFTMTVQFSFTGPPGTTVPYTTVTVTLTNSVGASAVFGPVSP